MDSASDTEAQFQKWLDGFSFIAKEEIALARSAFYAGMGVSRGAVWTQAQEQMREKIEKRLDAIYPDRTRNAADSLLQKCLAVARSTSLDPLPAGDAPVQTFGHDYLVITTAGFYRWQCRKCGKVLPFAKVFPFTSEPDLSICPSVDAGEGQEVKK